MNLPFANTPEFHGTVSVAADVTFGPQCVIWQFSTICEGSKLGSGVVVGSCAWIGKGAILGNDVRIQHGAFIVNKAVIGHRVFIGPGVQFTDDKYPMVNNRDYHAEPPRVYDDVSIGAGAVICPGVTLGRGARVGAGAVVTKDVAPFTTVIGIPAEIWRPHEHSDRSVQ
jgi:acetyltransferase-like isoleucine patch superfamily enzyme